MGKKQKRAKHGRKRRLLLLLLAVAIVSVLSTVVYAVSYSESADAFSQLSVYCSTYTKIPHVFSGDSHQLFTHYEVTFGVNNTSSTDTDASWRLAQPTSHGLTTQPLKLRDFSLFPIGPQL